MTDQKGSTWRKWDLHVHTPSSIIKQYGPDDEQTWGRFITDLESLPSEFKVLGINDYLFLDGYERVLAFREAGRLRNIDLILPVIELRIDKFGGSESNLSRVNLHIIFSNELGPKLIRDQFLNALPSAYQIEPQYINLAKSWHAVATKESLSDLGKMIIESVPPEKRADFGSPLLEGFRGINSSLKSVMERLQSHYFRGKYLTAVGKTEWADIKWNDQSIAEKKNIINSVHFVFTSCESVEQFRKSKDSLRTAGVNDRLLDCSDAHTFSGSQSKDRIGKCFTWIKADTSFEGLKQAFFEPEIRVHVDDRPPLDPIFKIEKAKFSFPADSKIGDDEFCLRGETEIFFSPNLTCLIGGRGVGKSMILNLIHEKLAPEENRFFKEHRLHNAKIADCVIIEGASYVEFLSQNEIEGFATDQERFTSAIFGRLKKFDKTGELAKATDILKLYLGEIDVQIERIDRRVGLTQRIVDQKQRVDIYRNIVGFLQDEQYKDLSTRLRTKTDRLEEIRSSSRRLSSLIVVLQNALKEYSSDTEGAPSGYRTFLTDVVNMLKEIIRRYMAAEAFAEVRKEEIDLQNETAELQKSLDDFLATKNLSAENLVDISRANQQLSSAEKELETIQSDLQTLNNEINAFVLNADLRRQYEAQFSLQLIPISEKLKNISSEVKSIGLEYSFDSEKARASLLRSFMKRLPPDEKGIQHREDYVSDIIFSSDPEKLSALKSFLEKLTEEKSGAKTTLAIKRYFENPDQFEIYKLLAQREFLNAHDYKTVTVTYDKKPLKDSSFGQRCTTAIVILVLLGNTPLIVDEPEAHLDSFLIATYLVELIKKQKQSRQIIFATHNANFVVNGDAELINVLLMGSDKRTKITPTTIENLDHRSEIVALEGGEAAFKHRDEKYEFVK